MTSLEPAEVSETPWISSSHPPLPSHGSDAEVQKHNASWAGRRGEREEGGGGLIVAGGVFLAPVTQLERRSTNKGILCPKWLPCKVLSTLIGVILCVCLRNKAGRKQREAG